MSQDAEYMLRSLQSEMYRMEDQVSLMRHQLRNMEERLADERKIADNLAALLYALEQENNFQVQRNVALIEYERARR